MRTKLHTLPMIAGLLLCTVLLPACNTLRPPKALGRDARGLSFSHSVHMNAKMECASCHDFASPRPLALNHELCSVCHVAAAPLVDAAPAPAAAPANPLPNIPEHAGPNAQNCSLCHVGKDGKPVADYQVANRAKRFLDEIKWDHGPHVAKGVACSECHGDPDKKSLPDHMLMPDCMKCHGAVDPKLNECSVCHKELDTHVVPKFHGTQRIQHDAPAIWEKIHGRESRQDAQYCAICHTEQNFCADCHRTKKPQSHSVTWERRTHGLEAMWNRQSCSTCHEEVSCLRCHEQTKPQSHMGGFGEPQNNHCVECHYPRGETGCAVCHQQIEHEDAKPSIHRLGLYPPNCGTCHPGGVPTRAPHLMNSTVECRVCHH